MASSFQGVFVGIPHEGLNTGVLHALVVVFTALLFVLAGCSTSDFGLGRRQCVYENDTVTVVGVKAWGLHLVTVPGNTGVQLGLYEAVYVYPKPLDAAETTVAIDQLRGLSGKCDPANNPPKDWRPLASATRHSGIAVDANEQSVGVSIGLSSRSALLIPDAFEGVVYLSLDPSDPAASKAIFRKVKK